MRLKHIHKIQNFYFPATRNSIRVQRTPRVEVGTFLVLRNTPITGMSFTQCTTEEILISSHLKIGEQKKCAENTLPHTRKAASVDDILTCMCRNEKDAMIHHTLKSISELIRTLPRTLRGKPFFLIRFFSFPQG